MNCKLLEQDLPQALWLLENQLESPADMVRFWAAFKTRQVFCPEIEKVLGSWWTGLWDVK